MISFDPNNIILAPTPHDAPHGATEAWAQQRIRMMMSDNGGAGWRNNLGVAYNASGVPIRFGLANDSANVNKKLKSSDIIGITPIIITPEYIGTRLGVFTSAEIKKPGWSYTGTEREKAQLRWMQLVISMGGLAGFSTGGW